jgi:hypothetical protein
MACLLIALLNADSGSLGQQAGGGEPCELIPAGQDMSG